MNGLALLAAFAAGAFGSAHCVLMCGGVASALGALAPRGARAPIHSSAAARAMLPHVGRVAGYTAIGAAAGAVGLLPAALADAQGAALGRTLLAMRLATALLIVAIGLGVAARDARPRWLRAPERWGGALWRRCMPRLLALMPSHPALRPVCLGALWGFMPCGLVYTVFLAAAVSGGPAAGAALATSFGLGTMPALLGVGLLGSRLAARRRALAGTAGAVLVACGLWTAAVPLTGLFTSASRSPTVAGLVAFCRSWR